MAAAIIHSLETLRACNGRNPPTKLTARSYHVQSLLFKKQKAILNYLSLEPFTLLMSRNHASNNPCQIFFLGPHFLCRDWCALAFGGKFLNLFLDWLFTVSKAWRLRPSSESQCVTHGKDCKVFVYRHRRCIHVNTIKYFTVP